MCDKKALIERYLTVLNNNLGWQAMQTNDGEITVPLGEARMWIDTYAPHDPEYVRMHTGFTLSQLEDDETEAPDLDPAVRLAVARQVAQRVSAKIKGAKVAIDRQSVVFAVEQVLAAPNTMPRPDHIAAVLPRMRMMLEAAIQQYLKALDDSEKLAGIEIATEQASAAGEFSGNTSVAPDGPAGSVT